MLYVIYATDTPNSAEKRRSVRPAHLHRLRELHAQKRLINAGPFFHEDTNNPMEGGVKGSIIIADFATIKEAQEWAAADPYVTAGVYASIDIHAFKLVDFP